MAEPHDIPHDEPVPDDLDIDVGHPLTEADDTSYALPETAILDGLLDEAMGRRPDGATETIQPHQLPAEEPDPDRYGRPGAVPDRSDDDGDRPNDGDLEAGDPPDQVVESVVEDAR